jgi:hypothetical protein
MSKYSEPQVVRELVQKQDIEIKGKMIIIDNNKGDIGINSKGKIDFLTRYCGYFITIAK